MYYLYCFIFGFILGIVLIYFYYKNKVKTANKEIQFLDGQIKNNAKEFHDLTAKVNSNADIIIIQKDKIKALKKKAKKVASNVETDNIHDLITLFDNME